MPKKDDSIELLKEIRDLERQQLAMMKAEKQITELEKDKDAMKPLFKMIYNGVIIVFVIGAFYYFYHTMYGTGLI